jgi:hypothetical protein
MVSMIRSLIIYAIAMMPPSFGRRASYSEQRLIIGSNEADHSKPTRIEEKKIDPPAGSPENSLLPNVKTTAEQPDNPDRNQIHSDDVVE